MLEIGESWQLYYIARKESLPFAMLLHGTALTPLVEILQKEHPDVLQPWYADDVAFITPAKRNVQLLNQITKYGPEFGHYHKPENLGMFAHCLNNQMLYHIL